MFNTLKFADPGVLAVSASPMLCADLYGKASRAKVSLCAECANTGPAWPYDEAFVVLSELVSFAKPRRTMIRHCEMPCVRRLGGKKRMRERRTYKEDGDDAEHDIADVVVRLFE